MTESFDITCAVPRSGRTFENFLNKLRSFDVDQEELATILRITQESKQRSSHDYAQATRFLDEAMQEAPCFGLFVDRKRHHRPYRVGFLGNEWTVNGVRVRVEGEEPHNGSSLIRLDEIDCAVVGLDELLTHTQYYLHDPTSVTKWGMYNYQVEKPTDIRIAGSAQLTRYNKLLGQEVQDIVGFFLISKPSSRYQSLHAPDAERPYPDDFLAHLAQNGRRVYVKGRYTGLVKAAYPELKIDSVEDVEDAVMDGQPGSVGLELVQTGNTIKQKGLLLHGAPLFLSESLWVVDYKRYLKSRALQSFVRSVKPTGYFADERIYQFALWYFALEQNMGPSWISKPSITDLFCSPEDIAHGLRPYRLQTRYWRPHDDYKQDEALDLVYKSRLRLEHYYEKLKTEFAKKPVQALA